MIRVETRKMKKLLTMIFGAFAIFFTGYPHVWSIYQPYVMKVAGWSQSQTSMCFYLALSSFVFGNILGGRLQDKKNPKSVIVIGGGIFTVGIIISSFSIIESPVFMYLTYGIMQGFGQGMIYTTIVSTAQKWFPDKTGFASGIVVTANGLCGFFLAPLSRSLLDWRGPKVTLFLVGLVIGISWILCSIFFFVPESDEIEKEKQKYSNQKEYTASEMIRTRAFYYLLVVMMLGLFSYFMVSPISQSYQRSLGIPTNIAVGAVMMGSIANAVARLVLPTAADKIGRIVCIQGVLGVCTIAMGIMSFSDSYAVAAAIIIIYACYGGIMGSFPSFTSSIFGMKHSGENYGYVMFGIVIATISAPVLTTVLEHAGIAIKTVFIIGAVFSASAFGCLFLLRREINKIRIEE